MWVIVVSPCRLVSGLVNDLAIPLLQCCGYGLPGVVDMSEELDGVNVSVDNVEPQSEGISWRSGVFED